MGTKISSIFLKSFKSGGFLRNTCLNRFFLVPLILFMMLNLMLSCGKAGNPSTPSTGLLFDSIPSARLLTPIINEISGIADSRNIPGHLWGMEDSDSPTQIYLIEHSGKVKKTVFIKGVTNRDWEEMTLFEGNIFIAETGDNASQYPDYSFYKFAEPLPGADTVYNVERIRFKYPSGSKDSEAFLIDPDTKDIHVISKNEFPSRVYTLKYPYNANSIQTLVAGSSLGYGFVVASAISPDGKEIFIKTYSKIYRYARSAGETVAQALQKSPQVIPHRQEPQGESIGFSLKNDGFFTLSEKGMSSQVQLYFYKRN
jgi:hypothetical protein